MITHRKKTKLLSRKHRKQGDLKFPTKIPTMYLSVKQYLKLFETKTEDKTMIHREQIEEIVAEIKEMEKECRQQGSGYGAAVCDTIIKKLEKLLDKEQVGGVP